MGIVAFLTLGRQGREDMLTSEYHTKGEDEWERYRNISEFPLDSLKNKKKMIAKSKVPLCALSSQCSGLVSSPGADF